MRWSRRSAIPCWMSWFATDSTSEPPHSAPARVTAWSATGLGPIRLLTEGSGQVRIEVPRDNKRYCVREPGIQSRLRLEDKVTIATLRHRHRHPMNSTDAARRWRLRTGNSILLAMNDLVTAARNSD